MKIPKEDIMKATIKGAIGAIPIAGSFLSEYLGLAFDNVAEARRNEWMDLVNDRLKKLEKLGHTMEELSKNEYFYTSIQLATQGAMKAHQKEKREMFANAIYNGFFKTDTLGDKELFYFSLLDRYTLTHIELLRCYSNAYYSNNIAERKKRIFNDFSNGIEKQLLSDGLLTTALFTIITKSGERFLNFIKTPEEETK